MFKYTRMSIFIYIPTCFTSDRRKAWDGRGSQVRVLETTYSAGLTGARV